MANRKKAEVAALLRGGAAGSATVTVGGLRWPAIPSGRFLPAMALQVQLEQSQWWSPERLLAHQLLQIQSVIAHAAKTVPFYRDRLGPVAGLPAGKLTLDALRTLPLLTRTEIQDAGDGLVTRALPKSHGRMLNVRTSGSTGRPVELKASDVVGLYFQALSLRYHLWHRRDLAGKSITIETLKPGQRSRSYAAWAPVPHTGPVLKFNQSLPAGDLLDMVIAEDPDYLQLHPSTLHEMIRLSRESGKKPARLCEVRTVSEVLEPEVRAMCETHWGVPVAENYSCEELGIIAAQCPDHSHLHVQSENCLVEIIGDDGMPCAPGQSGRTVITSLNNFATPLIRYENGDIAEAGPPCPCGRGLPVLNRIAGRVRNLAVLPSGEKVMPILASEPMLNELPIRQFQLVQKTVHEIEARVVAERPLSAGEEARFAELLQPRFRPRVPLPLHLPGRNPAPAERQVRGVPLRGGGLGPFKIGWNRHRLSPAESPPSPTLPTPSGRGFSCGERPPLPLGVGRASSLSVADVG